MAQAVKAARTMVIRFNGDSSQPMRTSGSLPDDGLLHAACSNAGGADAHVLACALDYGLHAPQIRIPAPARHIVSVADGVAIVRLLAANFTCECHVRFAPDWGIFGKA